MTIHVVVMTGRNVANLAPLLHQWKAGDTVVLVPTREAPAERMTWFKQRLDLHGLVRCVQHAPLLDSHPAAVAEWLRRADVLALLQPALPQPPAAEDRPHATGAHLGVAPDVLQLVGNGGTKPMQDMLSGGLSCLMDGSPVLVTYAEARPARLLQLRYGSPAIQQDWHASEKGMVTLDDVLGICGHVRPQQLGRLLWKAGQPTAAGKDDRSPWPADALPADGDGWRSSPALIDTLRNQVASALLDLLDSQPALAAITAQLWLAPQAHVAGEQAPRARWDVLLLLRNGILVHLDCTRWHPLARDDCHAEMQALIDTTVLWVPLPPARSAAGSLADHCRQTLIHHQRLGRRPQAWLWPGSEFDLGHGKRLAHADDWLQCALLEALKPYLPSVR